MANNLTLSKIKDECSLSCEITCDFEHGGNLTTNATEEGVDFDSDSGKLKIHYGKEIYLIKKLYIREAIHGALYITNTKEFIMECVTAGPGNEKMLIFLPIRQGTTSNKNGETIVQLTTAPGGNKPVAEFERIFPLDTPYIMYNALLDDSVDIQCVVISSANIVIDTVQWPLLWTPPISFLAGSPIKYVMKNMAGIKKGQGGANRVETIECLPINDNGILLTDVEKGLGDSNITSRFNFNEIIARALKIPALRIIGGAASVILFYKIMSMMARKKNIGLKTMSEINN